MSVADELGNTEERKKEERERGRKKGREGGERKGGKIHLLS